MNCLKDYIGIDACVNTASASGVYINKFLPGIEWKQIEEIADSDTVGLAALWSDIQDRAATRFRTDVNVALQNKFGANGYNSGYKLKQITQTNDLGIYNTSTTYPAAAELRGFTIKISEFSSNLNSIYVQSVKLYAKDLTPYTITFRDAKSGVILHTESYTAAAANAWYTIPVEVDFAVKELNVVYDSTGHISQSLPLDQLAYYDQGCDCLCYGYNNCEAYITGYKNALTSSDSYGLSGVFSIRCKWDNLVCNNKEYFMTAWAYCLGAELMTERIYSSRINRWTTIDKNRAMELRKEFEARYVGGTINETKYAGELNNAVYGLSLNQNDCCIECDAPVSFKNVGL